MKSSLVLVVVHIALLAGAQTLSLSPPLPRQTCTETACREMGDYMSELLVKSNVDACSNFFGHVCHAWAKMMHKPPHAPRYSMFGVLDQQHRRDLRAILDAPMQEHESAPLIRLRSVYLQCMAAPSYPNYKATSNARLRTQIRAWKEIALSPDDLTQAVVESGTNGASFLFAMTADTDPTNSSSSLIWLRQGGLSLPSITFYTQKQKLRLFTAFIQQLLIDFDVVPYIETARVASEMVDLEVRLAQISSSLTDMRNPYTAKRYNRPPPLPIYIERQNPVMISPPAFFDALPSVLSNTSPMALSAYFVVKQIMTRIVHLSYPPLDTFKKNMYGTAKQPHRKQCLDALYHNLPHMISYVQLMRTFGENPDSRRQMLNVRYDVSHMVEKIREQYLSLLETNTWIGEATRIGAITKIRKIRVDVGWPEWALNETRVMRKYQRFTLGRSWLHTISRFHKITHAKSLARIHKKRHAQFSVTAMTVNAFYSQPDVRITVPFGILHAPLYHIDYPMPIKLAGIGLIIAHEFTHSLDSRGRHYDARGSLRNWWSVNDATEFERRSNCFIEQYGNYSVQGIPLNGRLTIAENIADTIAMRIVTAAAAKDRFLPTLAVNTTVTNTPTMASYQRQLSPQEVFLAAVPMSWCEELDSAYQKLSLLRNVHSPNQWRMNGIMHNSPLWRKIHGSTCKETYRAERCSIW